MAALLAWRIGTFDPMLLAAIVYGKLPFAEAEAGGGLRLEGDRSLAPRFVDVFVLPEKIA